MNIYLYGALCIIETALLLFLGMISLTSIIIHNVLLFCICFVLAVLLSMDMVFRMIDGKGFV